MKQPVKIFPQTIVKHLKSLNTYLFIHNLSVSFRFYHVSTINREYLSRVMRKPAFCICKNKGADQLHRSRIADECLCFCYIDGTILLLPKSKISSLWPSSVVEQPGLCLTWSETVNTCFLATGLI